MEQVINSLNLEQCRELVKQADDLEKIYIAEERLNEANITDEELEELVWELASISRELYMKEWEKVLE